MLKLTLILYTPLDLENREERLDKLNGELLPQFPELNVHVRETLGKEYCVVEFTESMREQAKKLEKFCKENKIPVTFIKTESSL